MRGLRALSWGLWVRRVGDSAEGEGGPFQGVFFGGGRRGVCFLSWYVFLSGPPRFLLPTPVHLPDYAISFSKAVCRVGNSSWKR